MTDSNKIVCFFMSHIAQVRHSALTLALRKDCPARPASLCRGLYVLGTHDATVDEFGVPDYLDLSQPEVNSIYWVRRCDHCDEIMGEDVCRGTIQELLYRTEDGRIFTIPEAPYGAMWHEPRGVRRPDPTYDGVSLVVKTPGGLWWVDGVGNGVRYVRSGSLPRVSVNPEVHIQGFRGKLKNGVLIGAA